MPAPGDLYLMKLKEWRINLEIIIATPQRSSVIILCLLLRYARKVE